ncbi:MAG: sulfotransferase [Leptolyngbya sp. SIO1D8]|nr:sulfotransferase [Leptolyngbya sp. SIO1D8]
MLQPSFFIVGAPKCGTTALCKYLNRHPEVYIPTIKELHFFDKDLKTKKKFKSLSDYLEIFSEGQGKICGEGSPTYLYSKVAAKEIYEFNPAAKIIIMLREPVEMMYSFHSQHLFNGSSETVKDFEKALDLESKRKQGKQIPDRCIEPQILFYREFASYTDQVKRYLDTFGEAQVKVILFKNFTRNTAQVFRETLEFLGADPDFSAEFSTKNSNKQVRSSVLQTLIKYPPAKVLEFGKYLLPIPQSWRRALLENFKSGLKRFNTERKPRPALDPDLRYRLMKEFEPEVLRLEALIENDLSHWRQDSR